MARATAHYEVFHLPKGEGGPAYSLGVFACYTRRDLVEMVNQAIQDCGFSDRSRRQVNLVQIWRRIQFIGSSSSRHFGIDATLTGDNAEIRFNGLTAEEYERLTEG